MFRSDRYVKFIVTEEIYEFYFILKIRNVKVKETRN